GCSGIVGMLDPAHRPQSSPSSLAWNRAFMLTFLSTSVSRNCTGFTRRDLLRVGALGLGGLTLPNLLRARAEATAIARKDTAVVWLFLPGGPSHLDTYDMKPDAPSEFRGP